MFYYNNAVITFDNLRRQFPSTSFPAEGPDDEWLVENNCFRMVQAEKPDHTAIEIVTFEGYVKTDDVTYTETYSVRDMNGDELLSHKAMLNAHLDNTRWVWEQGGVVVNGMTIPTRDRDKTLITGKILEAIIKNLADNSTFTFTLNGNEITISVGVVKAIGVAIAEHVQKTIDIAKDVRPKIDDMTLTTTEEVDAEYAVLFNAV